MVSPNILSLQVIPVPLSRASAVQDIFNLAAEKLGFKFMVLKGKLVVTNAYIAYPRNCQYQ